MTKILIIGAGRGGAALLQMFHKDSDLKIVAIVDQNTEAPGIAIARKNNIPTSSKLEDAVREFEFDVVVNVTGSKEVYNYLKDNLPSGMEILGGMSSMLLWRLVKERQNKEEELKRSLEEHQTLYKIAVELASAGKSDKIFDIILSSAMELTNAPAGSIVIMDEKNGMLRMVLAKGFSQHFISRSTMWLPRTKGLTKRVLNSNKPTIIYDITKEISPTTNPAIYEEGIRSIIGIPLKYNEKTIGILYLDDFKPREFTAREISILMLLATNATLAIEKMQILEKTEMLAITDELTQIYNHRYFRNTLSNETYRAKRYKHPVSLIMMDIDNFKSYNDDFGHIHGNYVLSIIAGIIKKNVRSIDTAARFGGEEFCIILPDTSKESAYAMAERIRSEVDKVCIPEWNSTILRKVTISLGVASFPDDTEEQGLLVKKADEAMYAAKKAGKNKVCTLSPA